MSLESQTYVDQAERAIGDLANLCDRQTNALASIVEAFDLLLQADGASHEMGSHFTAAHWLNGNGMGKAIAEARKIVRE
jgi:hypothetical protein